MSSKPFVVSTIILLLFCGVLAFFLISQQRTPKKDFTETSDPTKVVTDSGDVIKLPETISEGQLTGKTTESVKVIKEVTGNVENNSNTAGTIGSGGAPDVELSAGELLFGKRATQGQVGPSSSN